MSKAWIVCNYSENTVVGIFADTRDKAISYLMNTKAFGHYESMKIKVYRANVLDYLDHPDGYIMNWNKDEDRILMVGVFNMYCDETIEECKECFVRGWCSKYKEG